MHTHARDERKATREIYAARQYLFSERDIRKETGVNFCARNETSVKVVAPAAGKLALFAWRHVFLSRAAFPRGSLGGVDGSSNGGY